jgi:hypothetical protein
VSPEWKAWFAEQAEDFGISESELIRKAVEAYVEAAHVAGQIVYKSHSRKIPSRPPKS